MTSVNNVLLLLALGYLFSSLLLNSPQLPYVFGFKASFSFQKQSQKSGSVLQDGSRSSGLFRKGKTHSKIS